MRKYRPDWIIDVVVGRGKHSALVGLCNRVFHDQEQGPQGRYDSELGIGFYENFNHYVDRPNSKVTNCLAEVFGLSYDLSLGRYEVAIDQGAWERARAYLASIGAQRQGKKFRSIVIHYAGNTSQAKKSLAHFQAKALCDLSIRCGRVPVILDWDRRSPLPDNEKIFTPGCGAQDIWGGFGSGDASTIAALVSLSEAFIGIDSGPGKVASATETPSLVCWIDHHPIQFHDPAANTTHLIPRHHRDQAPCRDQVGIAEYFEKHYQFLLYEGDHGLVAVARQWLAVVLGCVDKLESTVGPPFVVPNGIGDTTWALLKMRSIAAGRPIDIILAGDPGRVIDRRTIPFLKRFPFVRDASVQDIPIHPDKNNRTNSQGRYVYVADGIRDGYHFLMPNAVLESGRRIEEWLPEHQLDWQVVNEFDWAGTDRGTALGKGLGKFVAFYLGPESGHTDEGHNRGFLWEPRNWVHLGKLFKERGCSIAVVGAPYDRSFWENYVRQGVGEAGQQWFDLIGHLEIGETFALLKEARCLISYQCGLGIFSHYLGQNVAMWWRPDGNSGHPEKTVCFHNGMKDSWTRPGYEGRYIGMLYGEKNPEELIAEIDRRGWLR